MIYPKIEECTALVGSKYALAVVLAKRAKDLTQKMPGEFTDSNVKELSYALNEIANGTIVSNFSGANAN